MSKVTLTPKQNKALENIFCHALDICIDKMDLRKSCLSCQHFTESSELCSLANERPPARTIVEGCEIYNQNDPF